jgi:hypothetical protein
VEDKAFDEAMLRWVREQHAAPVITCSGGAVLPPLSGGEAQEATDRG